MATHIERKRKLWSYIDGVFNNTITEEHELAEQPVHIKKNLYLHQRALLKKAQQLEDSKFNGLPCGENRKLYTNYGIIADRVGSGKSLVALSLAKLPPPDERKIIITKLHSMAMVEHSIENPKATRVRASLFVIPHSLMSQWEDYVQTDTDLNVIFCRKRKEASDKSILNFLNEVDAVFVSSTMWKFFDEAINPEKIHWSRIFIDEADTIMATVKNELNAGFIWLITASYLNIAFPQGIYLNLNPANLPIGLDEPLITKVRKISGQEFRVDGIATNSQYIRHILSYSDTNTVADLNFWRVILRNSDEFVDSSFKMPTVTHHQILCRPTANIRILESVIPNDVMEMLHAGDTRGAIQALGVADESPTKILESVTRSLRKDLDNLQKKYEFSKTLDYSTEQAKIKSMEMQEGKIKSLEMRIETIEKRMDNIASQNCPICYSDVETPTMTPCCKNLFCFVCLCESLKRQCVCPLCRAEIKTINDVHVVASTTNEINQLNPSLPKTKVEEFIKYVETNLKAKILLFSGYDATFLQLTSEMTHRGINFATINGSTHRISKVITEFSEGKHQVLLLNSKNVGSGLNIVAATDVFLFHKMNSETEKQIIGRAYRMGRTEPLKVHQLLHPNENI